MLELESPWSIKQEMPAALLWVKISVAHFVHATQNSKNGKKDTALTSSQPLGTAEVTQSEGNEAWVPTFEQIVFMLADKHGLHLFGGLW